LGVLTQVGRILVFYPEWMFACTTVLYKYMKSLGNGVQNMSDNTCVWSKIYQEFYHGIVHIANVLLYTHCKFQPTTGVSGIATYN
jgi:hypothetical protein